MDGTANSPTIGVLLPEVPEFSLAMPAVQTQAYGTYVVTPVVSLRYEHAFEAACVGSVDERVSHPFQASDLVVADISAYLTSRRLRTASDFNQRNSQRWVCGSARFLVPPPGLR